MSDAWAMIERCAVHQYQTTMVLELAADLQDQVTSYAKESLPLERFRHVLDEERAAPGSFYPLPLNV